MNVFRIRMNMSISHVMYLGRIFGRGYAKYICDMHGNDCVKTSYTACLCGKRIVSEGSQYGLCV